MKNSNNSGAQTNFTREEALKKILHYRVLSRHELIVAVHTVKQLIENNPETNVS